jgi:hypothetical protein
LFENVADSVSNGGLEGNASRVESRKVYANELTWLEDCVHSQMFTLRRGKCKSATDILASTLSALANIVGRGHTYKCGGVFYDVKPLLTAQSSSRSETNKYPVRETSRRRFKQVDFHFEDHELRGLEQNPDTKSRWAAMAQQGKKVMQFLDGGRYVAVVADGK